MTTEYRTPAQMIEDHLRSRGWSQRVLATVLGLTENKVTNIMKGRTSITTELALELNAVLGIDANELLRIQTSYELARAQLEFRLDPEMTTRATIFRELPLADMVRRGWLRGIGDVRDEHLDARLCEFFGVSALDEIEVLPHSAKKTDMYGSATPTQLAWLHRVKQIAEEMLVAKYSATALERAVHTLKALLVSPDAARKVSRILAECGVRLLFVESLPSAKIDGVCLWLDEKSPVIGMSLRFDRIDNFWFVLRHEVEHVLRGHGRSAAAMLDIELEKENAGTGSNIREEERVANREAANFCVPQDMLDKFITKKAPVFAERDIRGFAKTLGIHPGLIAGQLQHKTERYELFRNHLVKIRSIVTAGSVVDGWGDVAPVGE